MDQSGVIPCHWVACPVCGGAGQICQPKDPYVQTPPICETCWKCLGNGKMLEPLNE